MTRPAYADNANITDGYWGLVKELAAARPGERDAAATALAAAEKGIG